MNFKILKKNFIEKWTAVIVVVTMVAGVCYGLSTGTMQAEAATDAFEQSISGFPESYKVYLRQLHTKYPNWKFVPYNTGIDFYTAVKNEYKDNKSLIENAYSKYLKSNEAGDYNTATGQYIAKDGGSWVTASKNCIAYFMDPRNFLDNDYIYMFEQLSYDEATQTQAGVEAILQGSFMYKTEIGYLNKKGKYKSTDILYSTQILNSAKSTKVSAYYIASKILQEVGTKKHDTFAGMGASGSITGRYSGTYAGIYNFYNIGASSGANPIANGLNWAAGNPDEDGKATETTYKRPWTTPMKSILGGARYIGEKYINCGQNTTYFQRFNVNKDSKYDLYTHQYMTNIYGAANEGLYTSDAYNSLGIAPLAKTFIIPVYNNMPSESNTVVLGNSSTKTGTAISAVNLRKGPSTSYKTVISLSKGDVVTVTEGVMTDISFGTKWLSNPYWYKVSVTKDGKKYNGYVTATYINLNTELYAITNQRTKLPMTLKTTENIYYMSDNPTIATVDSTGYITGKKDGVVTVRAFTASGSMSAATVQVMSKGCVLDTNYVTLDRGKTKKLKVTVYPTDSTNKNVTYASGNKKVAKVSKKGKITAKAVGTAVISVTAEIGGVVGYCTVNVIEPVTSVALDKSQMTAYVGSSKTLTATVYPSNATYKTLTWKSSNTGIATVSSTGVVTGVSAGTVTITATSHNNKTISCTVKVRPKKVVVKAESKGYNSIKLTWDKTSDISGYWVYKKDSKGKYKIIATLKGTAGSYTDKELVAGKSYSYKVKSYKMVGNTKYKSKNSKAVTVIPIPGKTKILSKIRVNNGVSLTLKQIKGASGYKIYRSESKNGTYVCIKTLKKQTKTSYVDTKVVVYKKYYYKAVAYRKVSKKKVYGKYSKRVSIKVQ